MGHTTHIITMKVFVALCATIAAASADKPGWLSSRILTVLHTPSSLKTVTTSPWLPAVPPHMVPRLPPPTPAPTMLTTELIPEDTELSAGTLTTPSFSDPDIKYINIIMINKSENFKKKS